MSSKYLLVISKDYWGTQTSEHLATEFSKQLSSLINIPSSNITHLIGNDVNLTKLKETIYTFVNKSLLDNSHEPRLYIYINGHGNQTMDANGDEFKQVTDNNETNIDGQDELYQLPDGNLVDDEFTQIIDTAVLQSSAFSRPFVCIISDHCSSGSMIDKTQLYFDWISLGSSLDNQDSFVTGDGNVMTCCLINVLETNKDTLRDMTSLNLFTLLSIEMKNSFIGDLQSPTFHISHSNMMNFKLFS
jgi:hypothetical protein